MSAFDDTAQNRRIAYLATLEQGEENTHMTARFVGVAGLPRSGSTLLCQLLGEHPQIHARATVHCSALLRLRHGISDDDFCRNSMSISTAPMRT